MQRWIPQAELAKITATIIPTYFSDKPTDAIVRQLLAMTLGDSHHYFDLDQVWVVVDGDPRSASIVTQMRDDYLACYGQSFRCLSLSENRGKLGAIQAGMRAILAEQPHVRFLAIRDCDGDHANSVQIELVRAAADLETIYGHLNLLVIGSRASRHHPMGWIRGELETILDRLTIDATAYALAQQGRAINLRHCRRDRVPDISSGFKVYGRDLALSLFGEIAVPRLQSMSEYGYWHYGPETVTIVDAWLQDAVVAELTRLTWDGQPTTSFGEFSQLALYGELLAWVFARLEIPAHVAARLYDNVAPGSMLRTTDQGRQLLDDLRSFVGERVGPFSPPPDLLPFV